MLRPFSVNYGRMKRVGYKIPEILDSEKGVTLITLLSTRGSAPQVPGSTALFSEGRLSSGTLGGGVLEGDATQRAAQAQKERASSVYTYELNAEIDDAVGAICGGSALVLLDAEPIRSRKTFIEMDHSLRQGLRGVLATRITGTDQVEIQRVWVEEKGKIPAGWESFEEQFQSLWAKATEHYQEISSEEHMFFQSIAPLEDLIVVGAGHIGKALCHLASLLDFRVTLIDSRPEYANADQVPEAERILVEPVEEAMSRLSFTDRSYVVIVTRGHRDDAEALRACIASDIPYIGMIGSRRKIKLMREEFIQRTWATATQFDRIHAPVGLDIHSRTVQEIALSIAAQLVQVRHRATEP
jgi:xanthine dehydrogenase accessory factor